MRHAWFLRDCLLCVVATCLLCGPVRSASTGFVFPTEVFDPPPAREVHGFGGPWGDPDTLHNGVDVNLMSRDEAEKARVPVRAIADGKVRYAGSFGSGWGDAVFVEHDSPEGTFVAVYGHIIVDSTIGTVPFGSDNGPPVRASQLLGYIDPGIKHTRSQPHLHFGLFNGDFSVFPSHGWGSMPKSAFPGRWVDPSDYLSGRPTSASVLVLDVSGSMSQAMPKGQRKIDAVKDAVRDYLKTLDDDAAINNTRHQVAAISFSDAPNRLRGFSESADDIRQAIGGLEPQNMTNFGDSLEMAISMLEQATQTKQRTLLFFSDGKTNTGSIPRDDFLIDYDPASSPNSDLFRDKKIRGLYSRVHKANIRIITIGFGDPGQSSGLQKYTILPGIEPDLDDEVLRKMAETPRTGGQYINARDYPSLLKGFVMAYNSASNRQLVLQTTGTIVQGETQQLSFDPSNPQHQTAGVRHRSWVVSLDFFCTPAYADRAGQLLVTLGWDKGRLRLTLRDPSGAKVGPSYSGAHIRAQGQPINIFIDNPKRGKWSATIMGESVPDGQAEYYFLASSQMPPIAAGGAISPSGIEPQSVLFISLLGAIAILGTLCIVVAARRRAPGIMSAPVVAWLQAHEPGVTPRNVPMTRAVARIGRDPGNDVAVGDPRVSAHHAEVRIEDGRATVTDLSSTNGTWVNGERVEQRALRSGDRIKLGDTIVIFFPHQAE